jgi:competence protein ComEC
VPLAGALLVVGLAGAALALPADALAVPHLGDLAMAPAGLLASLLLTIARRAASLPGATIDEPLLTIGAPVAALAWWAGARHERLRVVAARIGPLALLAVLLVALAPRQVTSRIDGHAPPPAGPDVLRIAVLDIGQGDATLLAQGTHAVLVDTGPPDGRVVERVRELGVDRVDGVVLTHDSLDHRGGFDSVVSSLHPQWTTRPVNELGAWRRVEEVAPHLVDVCAGDGFDVGDAHVSILHPRCDGSVAPRTGDLHNDGATVLLVQHGAVRALIPADAEAPVLVGLALPRLDLLRVSHHGSADPALPRLLEQVHPAAAAISAGEGNDYGHPRQQVLDDLKRAGVLVRRTDRDGTIEFRSDGRALSIVE